jgi:rare lipoprotein A
VHGGTIAEWGFTACTAGANRAHCRACRDSVPSPTAHLVGADFIDMKRLSATSAALTAAVLTAAVALPAAAATGSGNGGASATPSPEPASQSPTSQQARTADYRAVKATWYGPGLYGNRMACGGRLTHRTLGVAHKRLPCGTKVALRYRGHTLVVPVIDRGPYSRGVDYDLTEATARTLGMTRTARLAAALLRP